jgi:TetR/AcrR family transcriptional repressor of nem operon
MADAGSFAAAPTKVTAPVVTIFLIDRSKTACELDRGPGQLPVGEPKRVARPRSFDEDKALDAAIACFWSRGLEATSVRDLAEHMGIQGPSLYNAFGDKRTLFARALERYATRTMRERIARLEGQRDPKTAIRTFVQDAIERSVADRHRCGCLLVNSALEVAPHDTELRARIAAYLEEIATFFRRNIAAAQAAGTIPPE